MIPKTGAIGTATATTVIFALILSGGVPPSLAAPPVNQQQPSAPPALARRLPKEIYTCQRQFTYRGQILDCDSNLARDAENLRPLLTDVPSALLELNRYQATRRQARSLAYTSTAGLLMILTGYFVRREVDGSRGISLGNAIMGGGLAITAGSVVFGLATLRGNEARLERAIRIHNEAKPDTPIELIVTTGVRF